MRILLIIICLFFSAPVWAVSESNIIKLVEKAPEVKSEADLANLVKRLTQPLKEEEDKAYVLAPVADKASAGIGADVLTVHPDFSRRSGIHASENVEHGGLTGARRPDDDDEFAFLNGKIDAVAGVYDHFAHPVFFFNVFQFDESGHNASL